MGNHTPGPWMAYGKSITAIGRTNTADCAVWGSIAYVVELSYIDDWDGSEWDATGDVVSNARLIAAAPEMLDMLIELQESAQYWSEYGAPFDIVNRLSVIISKAKGE